MPTSKRRASSATKPKKRSETPAPSAPTTAQTSDDGPDVRVALREVASLIPYARNARTHSEAQVAQIAASIIEYGWTNPVLADDAGIVAGHGRVLAARLLYEQGKTIKLPSGAALPQGRVPVIDCTGWSEQKRRAYIIADNNLALQAGWDNDMLLLELQELKGAGYDIALTGFDQSALDELLRIGDGGASGGGIGSEGTYSRKIVAPTYEPRGEKPPVSVLMDDSKTRALLERIEQAKLPQDVASFLRAAAQRHTVFYFGRIADFYAHSDASIQDLMEQSALVIVDFDRAIADGYVKLAAALAEQYDRDQKRDAAGEDEIETGGDDATAT